MQLLLDTQSNREMGMTDGSPAFTCICDEPKGEVLRSVWNLPFTPENLNKLWAQVSKFPTFMGTEVHTMQDMLGMLFDGDITRPRGLLMVVDEFVGVFFLRDIKGLHEASVHYTFFDRRHRGRVKLCQAALSYCFNTFGFNRLWTQVPTAEIAVCKYVETLGFTRVGTLRRNSFFKGRYFDSNVYDLLKEEFLNGERRS